MLKGEIKRVRGIKRGEGKSESQIIKRERNKKKDLDNEAVR